MDLRYKYTKHNFDRSWQQHPNDINTFISEKIAQ